MKAKSALSLCILFCCTFTLSAMIIHNDINKDFNNVKSEPGVFIEDYLFIGQALQFSGQAEDLVFLGRKLTFSGKTTRGLFAACQNVTFSGESDNGIMVASMDINITGKISSNNYVACRSLQIGETATIKGNLFAACADLQIDGILDGNLYTATHELVINNEIKGNVTAYARRIKIGEKGKITGTFTYTSSKALSKSELARISGTVTHKKKRESRQGQEKEQVKSPKATGFLIHTTLTLSFIITGLLLLFLPAFKSLNMPQSEHSFWYTALWGFIPLLMYPALVILSLVLVVTIPFGIVLIFAFAPLMYLAMVIGAVILGRYLVTKIKKPVQNRHYQFLIGALVLAILSLIPFISFLVLLLVASLGWGTYISFLFKKEI